MIFSSSYLYSEFKYIISFFSNIYGITEISIVIYKYHLAMDVLERFSL